MGTLTSQLIISLKDLVSGPADGVVGSLRKIDRAAQEISKISKKLNLGTDSLLNPLKNTQSSNLDETYYNWEQKLREIAVVAEASDEQMQALGKTIRKISTDTKQPAQDLLDAVQTYLQLGGKIENVPDVLSVNAKTARMTHSSPSDQMTAANAMIKAYGGDPSNPETVKKFDETILVASKGMVGGLHAFEEAMKSFAPVAKSMGISFEQAAALVQTLGGQFDAGEIGHALKTGFVRLLSPRSGAIPAMRAAGIDYTQFFNFDVDKMISEGGSDFVERLKGMGRKVSPALEEELDGIFENADLSKGTQKLQDDLTEALTKAYGHSTRKGKTVLDGQTAKDMTAAIAQAIQQYKKAVDGFDLQKFLDVMSKQAGNTPLLDKIFGVNRIPQFMDLLRQAGHYGERLQKIMDEAPGAIDRKWNQFFDKADSYSRSVDRLTAAWDNLWKTMADNGVGASIAKIANGLASLVESAQAHPDATGWLFWITTVGGSLATITGTVYGAVKSFQLLKSLMAAVPLATAATEAATAATAAVPAAEAAVGAEAVAGGAAAVGAGILGVLAAPEVLAGLGIVAAIGAARGGYNAYEKGGDWWDIVKGSGKGAVSLGFWGADDQPSPATTIHEAGKAVANGATVPPPQQAPSGEGVAKSDLKAVESEGQQVAQVISEAMSRIRAIVAGVDLTTEGQRIAQTLAQGLRAGIPAINAAANEMAHAAASAAVRGNFSDGGLR